MFTPINDMFVRGSGPSGRGSFEREFLIDGKRTGVRAESLIDGKRTGVPPAHCRGVLLPSIMNKMYLIFMYNIDVS